MEHPEKALFDEVRGLRNQLEEAKERTLKIELDYNEKVLAYETRKTINDRLNTKLDEFIKDSQKLTLIVNGKEYPFLRSFFLQNLFNVSFLTEVDIYELDMGKIEFKGLLSILRAGHNYFSWNKEDIPRKFKLEKKGLKDDKAFIKTMKNYLTDESFENVLNKFELIYSYVSDEKDIVQTIIVENPFSFTNKLDNYRAENHNEITLKDQVSPKAYFINPNGKIDIVFKSKVRVNKIGIRGFYASSSNWTPSNGKTTTKIYVSLDGINWEFIKNVPSNYGNGKEVTGVIFDKLITFRFLRFQTDQSNSFSLNYFSLKK
jgi:hypothetical protein